jgi:hypothetical protein
MDQKDIVSLRNALDEADTYYSRIVAFSNLLACPELTWGDLLAALKFPGFVADQAALMLDSCFKVSEREGRIVKSVSFWETYIENAGIAKTEPVKTRLPIVVHRKRK